MGILDGTTENARTRRSVEDLAERAQTARIGGNTSNSLLGVIDGAGVRQRLKASENIQSLQAGVDQGLGQGEFKAPALLDAASKAVRAKGYSLTRNRKEYMSAMVEEMQQYPELSQATFALDAELQRLEAIDFKSEI